MSDHIYADAPASSLHAIARAQGWVLDVDGCLVRATSPGGAGGTPIPGAQQLLRWLREHDRDVVVCTNASQRPVGQYASHLRAIGLDIADHEMITAATAAAAHIAARHPGTPTLAIGDQGLEEALREQQVELARPGGPPAGVVVVGAADAYTTGKLNAACLAVADHDAALYVTVDTPWFYGGMGRSVCASTAIAYAITAITGRRPEVCGKPSAAIAQMLRERLGGNASDIVVVGDTASIEIQLAHMMGALGVLVFSGGTTPSEVAGLPPEHRPHLQVNDVGALLKMMQSI
jgi:NagD protein